jgi:hypothetical protein
MPMPGGGDSIRRWARRPRACSTSAQHAGRDIEEGEEVGDPGPALARPRAPEMTRLLLDAGFAGAAEWRVGATAIRLS